jgi:hypothetical protein
MNQHQAGTAANPPGTGLEYRDPALSRPLAERAGWTDADASRESIHDAGHGARLRRPSRHLRPGLRRHRRPSRLVRARLPAATALARYPDRVPFRKACT